MSTRLRFVLLDDLPEDAATLVVCGRRERLLAPEVVALLPPEVVGVWGAMVGEKSPGDGGALRSTFCGGAPGRVSAVVVPDDCSRTNCPARPDVLAEHLSKALAGEGDAAVVFALDDAAFSVASATGLARATPLYSARSQPPASRSVDAAFLYPADDATDGEATLARAQAIANGVREAARLVDMPPNELNTTAFVDLLRAAAHAMGAGVTVIEGEALEAGGFGGLWGVGRAAVHPPALVVLEHRPKDPLARHVALVGKGIVYDTGGLSLKGKTDMPGMKADMGGAAAVFGAFSAAVAMRTSRRVSAVFCLAENSVGPESTRPDDVLRLYSGRTVEVNNTDAEGRLVLADGVAYAARHLRPDVIIDAATLTGAQLISTGKRHAAIYSNDAELEAIAVATGLRCGDLVFPIPYCPEFFRKEFESKVADLKNSVKDRMNAQASCAAQFIAEHLGDYAGPWMHVDLAGPAVRGERGTGFGVALLAALIESAV